MFLAGFEKIAVLATNISPESYYDLVGEKDPYIGAAIGSTVGTLAGLKKGPKRGKAKAALLGHLAGSAVGAAAGHAGGKALRRYQARRIRHLSGSLNLRATPSKASFQHEES